MASHKMKTEDIELKSLNYVRKRQIAEATDKANDLVLTKITKATSGIPSTHDLQQDWSKK